MKNYSTFFTILLLVFVLKANGQTFYNIPVPSAIPTTVGIGGNTITISGSNSPSFNNLGCSPTSPLYNWIGGGATNSYSYQFTKPISTLKLELQDIEPGEELNIYFNSQLYTVNTTEISQFLGICNNPTTYDITHGAVTSFNNGKHNALIEINPGISIFDVKVECAVQSGYNGMLYDIYFVNDTCFYPFTATATTPCLGDALSLSVDSLPGVTQYDWIKSSSPVSSTRNTQIPNTKMSDAGTYFVTATRGSCQYFSSVAATILTSSPPLINTTTNNGPLCPGSTLQLATATISGVNYAWTGPNNFTSTQQNASLSNITSVAEGKYYVRTVSTTTGCQSEPDSTTLVMFYPTAPPVASGNTLVCRGTTLNLNASSIPGATYTWIGPNGFNSAQQNPSRSNMSYADSGDYYVTATVTGCTSLPDTIHISVKVLTPTPYGTSNSPVCPGTDIIFSSVFIPNATYSWTGPSFLSALQNPVLSKASTSDAGSYYVTATVNGCQSDPDTVDVIVAILANTPKASNNGPLCPGKTLNLSANTIPNSTYEWKGPNFNSSDQNPTIPNVTTANAGKYYVYSVINGCKSNPDSITVVIDILTPTPQGVSNGPICRGGALNLSAGDITNASYSWTGPNNFKSILQNPVIAKTEVADSGNYIVIANVDGCNSLPDTIPVAFKQMPDILSATTNSPVCDGDSLELTAKGYIQDDKATYTWFGTNNFITDPLSQVKIKNLSMDRAGRYGVYATYDGCSSDTLNVDVVVKPKPVLPQIFAPATIRIGDTLKVSAKTATTGVTYRWVCPDGIDRTDTSFFIPDISKVGEGDYIITATLDGCSISSKTYVQVLDREVFTLYPNPNEGTFTVKASLRKDRKIPIEIINAMGQVVYNDASETKNKLMIKKITLGDNLPNGIYILRLGLDGHTRDMRFVIMK